MNRLSLAFFAAALLLVGIAVTALMMRAGTDRLAPLPAASEHSPASAQGVPETTTRM